VLYYYYKITKIENLTIIIFVYHNFLTSKEYIIFNILFYDIYVIY